MRNRELALKKLEQLDSKITGIKNNVLKQFNQEIFLSDLDKMKELIYDVTSMINKENPN